MVVGPACECGQRAKGRQETVWRLDVKCQGEVLMGTAGACTCEKAPDGGLLPGEIDFTTKA